MEAITLGGMEQMVQTSTHIGGNILDIALIYLASGIDEVKIREDLQISDHFAVEAHLFTTIIPYKPNP